MPLQEVEPETSQL